MIKTKICKGDKVVVIRGDASRFIDGVLNGRVVSRAYRALEAAAPRSA